MQLQDIVRFRATLFSLSDPVLIDSIKDALMTLIPRHERWPVLTSTQGYLIRNMRFINSRIRRYEMSSGIEDMVTEGLFLVDRGEQ